ncbi:MAG: class C sortase [Erysipelotrichaceae bacterium]|nr:class C sortase [Erysipelotrichaceae bacterium]
MKSKGLSNKKLLIILLLGIGLISYPTISNWWNSRVQTKLIDSYVEKAEKMSKEEMQAEFDKGYAYNDQLKKVEMPIINSDVVPGYEDTLKLSDQGMIGTIKIPKINLQLPVYHGTDEKTLSFAVGHIKGTSLPIGGKGSHAVLSAHRGLPSAQLFSNLDVLKEGDFFVITVLNRTFTYKVDQIRIVEPQEISDLTIDPDQDYVTLLTCTPYGVNTHRLLVRGHRVEGNEELVLTSEALELDSTIIAPVVAFPLLVVFVIFIFVKGRKKKPEESGHSESETTESE